MSEDRQNGLAPVRGIMYGVVLSVPLWALIYAAYRLVEWVISTAIRYY